MVLYQTVVQLLLLLQILVDFVDENPYLIDKFKDRYGYDGDGEDYTQENLLKSAQENNETWEPGEEKFIIFGDEQGTYIGKIFDYILRDGGESESFKWKFDEYLR
jgi:hypothetical protein